MRHVLTSCGLVGDGSTLNDAAFAALTLSRGDVLDMGPGAPEFVFADPITVPDNVRIVSESGLGALRWTSALGGRNAINAGAKFRPEGVTLIGPVASSPAFVMGQNGIYVAGTLANRKHGPILDSSVEIYGFGQDGVLCEFVYDPIVDATSHHNGYSGFTFLSSNGGKSRGMRAYSIVGKSMGGGNVNAYGICCSHESAGYDGLGRLSSKPFCSDWVIDDALVWDIDWEGIDFHGGFNNRVVNSSAFATRYGIAIATSSGDAINHAGEGNSIFNCTVDSRNRDGTQTPKYLRKGYGINVNGGSVKRHVGVSVTNCRVLGKGVAHSGSAGAIQAENCDDLDISHNTIQDWGGNAFRIDDSVGSATHNLIGRCGVNLDGYKYIFSSQCGAGRMQVAGNRHEYSGGYMAYCGLYKHSSSTMQWVDGGNDFGGVPFYSRG